MKIRPLSIPLQEKAINGLNEVPSRIEEDLKDFRNWLSKQEHIKYRDDDQLLVNFLRGSKYSLQRAKEKIDAYYTFRTLAPEIGRNMDPLLPEIQTFLKLGVCLPLPIPKDNPNSPLVLLCRLENYDPDQLTLTDMLKGTLTVINVLFNENDNLAVSGSITLCDLKGIRVKTVMQMTPVMIKKIVYGFEKAYPCRIQGFFTVNTPKYCEQALNLIKMFSPKKVADRMHFYSSNNLETIYENIPRSILPKEYGGDAGPIEIMTAEFKKLVEGYRETLINEDNYYSDESKRLGSPSTVENVFGVEGSFRKLEVD